jgi:ribonucleoside-diphosphate reductase alpha chain
MPLQSEGNIMHDEKFKPRHRPDIVQGKTVKTKVGCGNLYVTVNHDEDGRPFEVFAHMGKSGGCMHSQSEGIARMVSLALRSGGDPQDAVRQLKGIKCLNPTRYQNQVYDSCPDAIAKVLEACACKEEMKKTGNGRGKESSTGG